MYCLSDICTLCLVPNTNLENILSQDTDGTVVEEKLKVFLLELIHYQPNIPKYICSHCLLYLNYVYKFRLRCLENFTKFNKYVQKLEAHGPYTNLSVTLTDTNSSKNISMNIINSQESSIDADVVVKQEYEHVSNNFQTPYHVFQEFNEEKHIIDENINITSVSDESNLVGNSNSDLVESFEDNGSEDKYLPPNTSPSTASKRLAPSRTSSRRSASKADKSDSTVPDEQHSFGGCDSDLEPFEDSGSDDEYLPSNASSTASEASNSDLELIEMQSPASSTLAGPKGTNSHVTKYTSEYISTSDLRSTDERSQKSYKCDKYNKSYKDDSALINHKRSHASAEKFNCDLAKSHLCDVCDKRFMHKAHLLRHKLIHSGTKPYKCNLCDYKGREKSSLAFHKVSQHSGAKLHQCDVCDKKFMLKSHLISHKRTHSGMKPYKCNLCDYKCCQKNNLTRHKFKHSGAKPHQCDVCEKQFVQKAHMIRHKLIHSDMKPYKCDLCDYKCRYKNNLAVHKVTHSVAKPHQCDVCQKGFRLKDYLIRHKLIHSDMKQYKCDLCDYKCRQEINLTRHKFKHSGVKLYQCDVCDKGFVRKAHLMEHELIHSGMKPYKCDLCDFKCRHKQSLAVHKITHSVAKPHQCDVCDKGFVCKSSLIRHKLIHSRMK